jgi:hypothetical protein
MFRGLKPQSLIKQLHSYTKFLHFLERYKFIEPGERRTLNLAISHWRKYLLKFVQSPINNPILDVTVLRLNDTYAAYITMLLDTPEFIINTKISVRIRDAAMALVASRFGKRPCELSTLSVWHVLHPTKVENTYLIDSVMDQPSKTTSKYGKFQLYVSASIFNILQLYCKYARPLLAKGEIITQKSYLWITTTGKCCSGKVVADVINRALESGNSGVRIGSRNIRHTLATMATIYSKNNLSRNQNWKGLDRGIARGMRHSIEVHESIYVKKSEVLYLSRVDSLTEAIMSGVPLNDSHVSKLTDSSINQAMMPSSSEAPVPIQTDHTVHIPVRPTRPTERGTPVGNLSTYEYIEMLYDMNFDSHTNISSVDIRMRLDAHPLLVKKLLENLRLKDFKNLSKLSAKATTYKRFLIRQCKI